MKNSFKLQLDYRRSTLTNQENLEAYDTARLTRSKQGS